MVDQDDRGPGAEVSQAVAALAEEDVKPESRRQLLARLVKDQVDKRGVRQLLNPGAAVHWMVDAITEVAPHLPVRDLDTLRLHYDGLDGQALAEPSVRKAARVTAGRAPAG